MPIKKCRCADIINFNIPSTNPITDVYVHIFGCPEDYQTLEYDKLPWWKKIFKTNPHNYYNY